MENEHEHGSDIPPELLIAACFLLHDSLSSTSSPIIKKDEINEKDRFKDNLSFRDSVKYILGFSIFQFTSIGLFFYSIPLGFFSYIFFVLLVFRRMHKIMHDESDKTYEDLRCSNNRLRFYPLVLYIGYNSLFLLGITTLMLIKVLTV